MTEQEWLAAAHPKPMLALVRLRGGVRDRKFRLFEAACCHRVNHLLPDPGVRPVLALAARYLDGAVPVDVLVAAADELGTAVQAAWVGRHRAEADTNFGSHPAYVAAQATELAVYAVSHLYDGLTAGLVSPTHERGWDADRPAHELAVGAVMAEATSRLLASQSDLKTGEGFVAQVGRDELRAQAALLRDIFANPFRPVTLDPAWQTSTVLALAAGISADRAWDRLPILADSLQDAGCNAAELLGHLRGPGPHVRGCWALDLVSGKD